MPFGQTTAFARRCRCAHRSARRKRWAGSVTPAHPAAAPGAPRRDAAPGVRYASHPAGRVVPGKGGAGRGMQPAHHHTGAGCDRAPTKRPARADGLCKAGEKPPAKPAKGLAKAAGLCNGWRAPSRRLWRRSGKRAAPGADPRATLAKRPKGAEQARRPAARVGRVGPLGPRGAGGCHQAAGGTPATFRALSCSTAPWRAECSIGSAMAARSPARCAGRALVRLGEKERGPALAGWPSLKCGRSRVPPSSVHPYCITTNRCCQGLRCSFLDADKLPGRLAAALRGALPPWGGRGVGLLPCLCRPAVCRRTKKALDSLAGVWYGKAVGSISLNGH